MSLDALIMFSGAMVALLPFLGFPNSWDAAIFLALGLFIVGLGVVVRRRRKSLPRFTERAEQKKIENVQMPVHE